jgi:predicted Zn finger-like uncharacterized protein
MSFTTRCPACGTTFRIVPDQLKISDGWVRCGHCADVFDATLFLEGEAPAVPTPVTAPPVATSTASAAPAAPSIVPPPAPVTAPIAEKVSVQPALAEAATASVGASASQAGPAPAKSPVPDPVPDPLDELLMPAALGGADDDGGWLLPPPVAAPSAAVLDESFVEELRSFAHSAQSPLRDDTAARAGDTTPATTDRPSGAPSAPPVAGEGAVPPVPASSSPAPAVSDEVLLPAEPSFVRQAKRRAFWQSRGVRVGLHVAALALALGLVSQVAVHQRDALVARYPALGPVLSALCQPLSCELGPVHRIESVVIDSSTLVRRLGSFYSFDLVLRNSAPIPVAVPALELSLTDTRDAVIVRRVFLREELPGAPQVLPPQGNLSLSLRLSIAEQGTSSMSGYRALVFYP